MSIVTKTGDAGATALMYNRRVPKCHPQVEAYGAVDELNAAIGLARATTAHDLAQERLEAIQKDLIALMGELATVPGDLDRYIRDGYGRVTPEMTARLEQVITEIEAQKISFQGWAIPGGTRAGATLDLARTICRRAERRVCGLGEQKALSNPEILIYLNRLSDLLWLLARWEEAQPATDAGF